MTDRGYEYIRRRHHRLQLGGDPAHRRHRQYGRLAGDRHPFVAALDADDLRWQHGGPIGVHRELAAMLGDSRTEVVDITG
jgi:hypothetical protein